MSARKLDRATQVVLTVVTANVGRGVGPAEAAANIRRVIAFFARYLRVLVRGDVSIGWQEIDEADAPDEHGILHRLVRKLARGTMLVGFNTAVPVGVPKGWRAVWVATHKTCEGKAGATPHRVCVAVLMEHKRTGIRVLRLNGHWPRDEIRDRWDDCDQTWRELIDEWLDLGYVVVVTCDRNKAYAGRLSDPEKATESSLLPASSIDEVRVIYPKNPPERAQGRAATYAASRPTTAPMTVDGHDADGVAITLTAAQEAA